MTTKTVSFSSAAVKFIFDAPLSHVEKLVAGNKAIFITDDNVYARHKARFKLFPTIVISAGEQHKQQATVDTIINQLVELGADRKTYLIGVGGGVVTDITGYVAGIFMRGVSFGFIPTTILAMVDAAIGGKNGIDVGLYKNMVGLTRQPAFILYDYTLLKTLPAEEWVNGFAEIIKHACIKDARLFAELKDNNIRFYQKDLSALAKLVQKNVSIKTKIVQADEFENGDRKLLNFGHTVGHAVETLYQIPHGHAISIGMGIACKLSAAINGFSQVKEVSVLLKQYGLPPQFEFDKEATFKLLSSDKKRINNEMNYILLQKIGKGVVHPITMDELKERLNNL
jgi:3-dehydroquinate synthase